jgi:hypothetical protein
MTTAPKLQALEVATRATADELATLLGDWQPSESDTLWWDLVDSCWLTGEEFRIGSVCWAGTWQWAHDHSDRCGESESELEAKRALELENTRFVAELRARLSTEQ